MASINEVLLSIQQAEEGRNLQELLQVSPDLNRRTAQRWLKKLVDDKHISVKGQGRARRYFPASQTSSTIETHDFPQYIPLSIDSKDIVAYLQQPLAARRPIAYQRDFLLSYQPNQSFYLSESLRRQLHKMGDTRQGLQPAGTYGRDIYSRLLIDLSWASSHLEGNTYSRLDTCELIEHGNEAEGKASIETQMILNHKAAIELLVDDAEAVTLNRFTLMNIHSLLAENLLPNPADEGRLREHTVEIGMSVFRPLSVPAQVLEMFECMLEKAREIADPFEQAFFMMVHLPYLQPFADVNKRTSRLAANLPLIKANLCPLTFVDVPEQAYSQATLGVYEMTRVELLRDLFVWAYERSTQTYIAIKQDIATPDPLRLTYRDFLKATVKHIVLTPDEDALTLVQTAVQKYIPEDQQQALETLIIDELRRLHEGVLARFGLRPSQLKTWLAANTKDAL